MESTVLSGRQRSKSSPLNSLSGQQSLSPPSLGSRATTLPLAAGSGGSSHRRFLSQDYRPRSPSKLSLCARPADPDASVGMVRSTSHQPTLDFGDLPPGGNMPSSLHSVAMSRSQSAQAAGEDATVNLTSFCTTQKRSLNSVPMGRSRSETMPGDSGVSQAGSIPQHERPRIGTPLLTVPLVGTEAIMVGPWAPAASASLSPTLDAMRHASKRLLSFASNGGLPPSSATRPWRQRNHRTGDDVWTNGDGVLVVEEEQPSSNQHTDTVHVDFCGLPSSDCHDFIPKESVICAFQIPKHTRAQKHQAIRDSLKRSLGTGMSTRQWAMSPHANLRPEERSLMLRLDTEAQLRPNLSSRDAKGRYEALLRSRAARRTPVISSGPSTAYWLGTHRYPAGLADRKGLFGRYNEAPTPPMPADPQDMLDEVSKDTSLLYDAPRFDQKVRERNSARAYSVKPTSVAPSMSRRPSECPSLTTTETTGPTTPLDTPVLGGVYSLGATCETKGAGSVPRTLPSLETPTIVTALDDWSNSGKEFSGGAESYGQQFEGHLETNYPTTLEGL